MYALQTGTMPFWVPWLTPHGLTWYVHLVSGCVESTFTPHHSLDSTGTAKLARGLVYLHISCPWGSFQKICVVVLEKCTALFFIIIYIFLPGCSTWWLTTHLTRPMCLFFTQWPGFCLRLVSMRKRWTLTSKRCGAKLRYNFILGKRSTRLAASY